MINSPRQNIIYTILKILSYYFLLSHRHSHLILFGLLFSSVGDALLNWNYFEGGMAAFGVAQIFYICAFKFKPLNPLTGLIFYGIGVLCEHFLVMSIK